MKYSQQAGVLAALILVFSAFLNWTWHPDLQKFFTGFFSQNNVYGKPGKVFFVFCALAIVLYLVPRIWAKRTNVMLCALTLSFAIRCFILFSGCYRGICPEKQPGLWIMLGGAVAMMIAALLPDLSLKTRNMPPV